MKKLIIYISIISLFWSCSDPLDKHNLKAVDGQDVWADYTLATLFLNDAYYRALPQFAATQNTNISDESYGPGTGQMMQGLLTKEDNYSNYNRTYWYVIREANIVLEEVPDKMKDERKEWILGQAYFLRAWVFWDMIKYYGGLPIVNHTIDVQKDFELTQVPRNSARECIEQIVEDFDNAASKLPSKWTSASDYGRPTRATALALKGRVLLYYASPQFNPDNDIQRWTVAYNANQAALAACNGVYSLYENFAGIFVDEDDANEALFIRGYTNSDSYEHTYENDVRPNYAKNKATGISSPPNWEFVKSFPMADGLPIKGHPGYDSVYFWKNRDPRLAATVGYNGMEWEFKGVDIKTLWTYENNPFEGEVVSPTGFYLKKNVNTNVEVDQTEYTETDWIEMRLAEVYLNLAECAAEVGKIDSAKSMLIEIRKRAGIEEGDGNYGITAGNRDEMVEAVMLERKIELAFENKRHWDLRRRNMFINDLNNTPKINGSKRHGVKIELDTAFVFSIAPDLPRTELDRWGDQVPSDSVYSYFAYFIADTIDVDKNYDKYFKTTTFELDNAGINYLQPKYNFYFIPQDEMDKDPQLLQTIYWNNGTDEFDPLDNN